MEKTLQSICYMNTQSRLQKILEIAKTEKIPCNIQQNKNATNVILFPNNRNIPNILFTAHYDIIFGSCGANDNGSSVAILFELARWLKNRQHNIVIAFLDREESGGYGCEMYFNNCKTDLMVNLDVCGCGDKIVMCDETRLTNNFTNAFRASINDNIVMSDNMPYCDGRHAERMGNDVWHISVFPEKDAKKMGNIKMSDEDKAKMRLHTTGYNVLSNYRIPMGLEIFKYMHNGKKDDIKYINYDIMRDVLEFCKKSLENLQFVK